MGVVRGTEGAVREKVQYERGSNEGEEHCTVRVAVRERDSVRGALCERITAQ